MMHLPDQAFTPTSPVDNLERVNPLFFAALRYFPADRSRWHDRCQQASVPTSKKPSLEGESHALDNSRDFACTLVARIHWSRRGRTHSPPVSGRVNRVHYQFGVRS